MVVAGAIQRQRLRFAGAIQRQRLRFAGAIQRQRLRFAVVDQIDTGVDLGVPYGAVLRYVANPPGGVVAQEVVALSREHFTALDPGLAIPAN